MLRPPRLPSITGDPELMSYLRQLQAFLEQSQIRSGADYLLAAVRPTGTTLRIECPCGGGGAGTPGKYQEIRLLSHMPLRGFTSFTDATDDTIYSTLRVRINISNFPNSSSVDMTVQYSLTGPDVYTFSFVPSEAAHRANMAVLFPTAVTITSSSETSLVQDVSASLACTQRFDLSAPFLDPLASSKSIRAFQRQMVANLATLKTDAYARINDLTDAVQGEAWWDTIFINSPDGIAEFSYAQADFNGAPEDFIFSNTDTSLFNIAVGQILQIERGTLPTYFKDVLGIDGGAYYPGRKPQDRRSPYELVTVDLSGGLDPLQADQAKFGGLFVFYPVTENLIWTPHEDIWCQEVKLRIRQSPVFVKLSVRDVLDNPAFFLGPFGPDVSGLARTPTSAYPVDGKGRVQFESLCPANTLVDFWDENADQYCLESIFCLDATKNVNGFVIPP